MRSLKPLLIALAASLCLLHWTATESLAHATRIWRVSSGCKRPAATAAENVQKLKFQFYTPNKCWVTLDYNSFLESCVAGGPVIFVANGNPSTQESASNLGWTFIRKVQRCAPDRICCIVLWNWPLEPHGIRKNIKGFRFSSQRAEPESVFLASCVTQIPTHIPLTFVGYSFGGRMVSAALQMLATSRLCRYSLPDLILAPERSIRCVLIASALDNYSFGTHNRYGSVLTLIEGMYVSRNKKDIAMRLYTKLFGRGGPDALGLIGPINVPRGFNGWDKIRVVDYSSAVGKSHDWEKYLNATRFDERFLWYLHLDHASVEVERVLEVEVFTE